MMSEKILNSLATSRFRRAYLLSTSVFSGLVSLGLLRSWVFCEPFNKASGIGLALACMPLIPILLKGGISSHKRLAWGISVLMVLLIGSILADMRLHFYETSGEGPNGEGSPLAFIIAMVFFSILFFCPWLLTAIRGLAIFKENPRS